ncbi:DUF1857-domain-containing protein [Lophiostoma macrostomum CBS 122681]|uniref:DUF1857-domain-containing protein n=1 Tax=Lophiostoma macrostomum CBS 122681 TaxID=1314788 RepID=A0A6A6T3A3_9PLEO|nr:DUF1857-domain-containing protein [Lophiostoma macrostomum CBS 122681]
MVKINLAWTSPINPKGVEPLTIKQLWAGLQRKIRYAHEFVPVIESCEVLSDEDGVVKRIVKFKDGAGPKPQATETVRGYEHSWVDFEQEDGTHVRNIISDSSNGSDTEKKSEENSEENSEKGLLMTYTFEIILPNVEEGEAAKKEYQRLKKMAEMAVNSTIKVIREMVQDGRIAKD